MPFLQIVFSTFVLIENCMLYLNQLGPEDIFVYLIRATFDHMVRMVAFGKIRDFYLCALFSSLFLDVY